MSQRYFLTTESTYEALRLAVDSDLGYPTATASSIFTPALQAPRDSLRRIVLAVDTSLPGYGAITSRVSPLLANSSVQELTEAEYLAFLACVPTTTDAIPFTQVTDTITYTNFLPSGGSLDSALSGIDSALTGKADYAHGHYGLLTGWRGQWDETTHNAGGYSQNDVVVIQNEYYTGLFVCAVSTSSGDVSPGDLGFPQISTSTLVVSVAGKSGVVTLGPSDVGAAALSHAHSATADLTFAGATAGQVLTVNSGATALVWATPSTYTLPVATSSVLGGVKQGSNVTIAGDGTISVAAPVTSLPYSSITGTPTLATVATSGSAADLSGTLNAARLPSTTVTAGSYGGASSVGTFTVDAAGRLTAAGSTAIAIASGAVSGLGSLATQSAVGNISSAGAIGSTANLPVITTTSGVLTTGTFGTVANSFCQGNDSRLTTTLVKFTPGENQPPASNYAILDTRNSILVLKFDPNTQWSAVFCGVIPQNASLTNGLTVRIWWMGETATSGNVRWGVSFENVGTDNDADSFDTVTQAHSAANATSGIETVTSITATAIDSLAAGDRFRLKVTRIADDATNDTMTGTAQLVAVEVQVA